MEEKESACAIAHLNYPCRGRVGGVTYKDSNYRTDILLEGIVADWQRAACIVPQLDLLMAIKAKKETCGNWCRSRALNY